MNLNYSKDEIINPSQNVINKHSFSLKNLVADIKVLHGEILKSKSNFLSLESLYTYDNEDCNGLVAVLKNRHILFYNTIDLDKEFIKGLKDKPVKNLYVIISNLEINYREFFKAKHVNILDNRFKSILILIQHISEDLNKLDLRLFNEHIQSHFIAMKRRY